MPRVAWCRLPSMCYGTSPTIPSGNNLDQAAYQLAWPRYAGIRCKKPYSHALEVDNAKDS